MGRLAYLEARAAKTDQPMSDEDLIKAWAQFTDVEIEEAIADCCKTLVIRRRVLDLRRSSRS